MFSDLALKYTHAPHDSNLALLDLLEAQLAKMKPCDEVRFAYPSNYFSWGIAYLYYPPEMTVSFLKLYTGQDFGMDAAKWRSWLSK